jgi:hypothetical protein
MCGFRAGRPYTPSVSTSQCLAMLRVESSHLADPNADQQYERRFVPCRAILQESRITETTIGTFFDTHAEDVRLQDLMELPTRESDRSYSTTSKGGPQPLRSVQRLWATPRRCSPLVVAYLSVVSRRAGPGYGLQ